MTPTLAPPRPAASARPPATALRRVVLVGGPNVGKSCLFTALTGKYVAVSNYPGTTVEVSRATMSLGGTKLEVLDTPGMHSLRALREEERTTQRLLLEDPPDLVVHVAAATQLARSLVLTCELLETGIPVVLALNQIDELERKGFEADAEALSRALGIPVVATAAVTGRGVDDLRRVLQGTWPAPGGPAVEYAPAIGRFLAERRERLGLLGTGYQAAGLLLLDGEVAVESRARALDSELLTEAAVVRESVETSCASVGGCTSCPLSSGESVVSSGMARKTWAARTAASVLRGDPRPATGREGRLDKLLLHPWGGYLVLAAILYSFYQVVGVFGAGTLVDFLEGKIFGEHLTPWITAGVDKLLPWTFARDLFVGENGLWTLGITYAVAIIVPVVGFFYLCFGFLEDSGYLPRLGVLVHRFLVKLGLGGQAAIPLILGLGCVTMATLATRALPSRRERLIAVILLSLATPCAAQLGVVLAILSFSGWALLTWMAMVLLAFVATGWVAGRSLPGPEPQMLTELPPLRMPAAMHVLRKSAARIRWYLVEILPFFLWASVILWGLDLLHVLPRIETGIRPLATLVGLPSEASRFLLFGFFRRDYGAAGLYDLALAGVLSPRQLMTSAVLLTLFIPCVAQLMVLRKEFGRKLTAAIVGFVFVAAFSFAGLLNLALTAGGMR